MPYINSTERETYQECINYIVAELVGTAIHSNNIAKGHLNYIVTAIIKRFIERTGLSYAIVNDMIGVLECCKLELYRRLLAEYEDEKIQQNGDVE